MYRKFLKEVYSNELNLEQMGLIIGSIMGDGTITKNEKGVKNSYMEISHSDKQLDYLIWKRELFINNGFDVSEIYKYKRKEGYSTNVIQIRYKKNPQIFNNLRKLIYFTGRKRIRRKILNWLTPQGLAIMHMDDGTAAVNICKKTGNIRWRAIHIATHNMTLCEHKIFQKYMKKNWNIDVAIYRDRTYYRTNINATNAKIFINIIENLMCDTMKYKIDLKYIKKS